MDRLSRCHCIPKQCGVLPREPQGQGFEAFQKDFIPPPTEKICPVSTLEEATNLKSASAKLPGCYVTRSVQEFYDEISKTPEPKKMEIDCPCSSSDEGELNRYTHFTHIYKGITDELIKKYKLALHDEVYSSIYDRRLLFELYDKIKFRKMVKGDKYIAHHKRLMLYAKVKRRRFVYLTRKAKMLARKIIPMTKELYDLILRKDDILFTLTNPDTVHDHNLRAAYDVDFYEKIVFPYFAQYHNLYRQISENSQAVLDMHMDIQSLLRPWPETQSYTDIMEYRDIMDAHYCQEPYDFVEPRPEHKEFLDRFNSIQTGTKQIKEFLAQKHALRDDAWPYDYENIKSLCHLIIDDPPSFLKAVQELDRKTTTKVKNLFTIAECLQQDHERIARIFRQCRVDVLTANFEKYAKEKEKILKIENKELRVTRARKVRLDEEEYLLRYRSHLKFRQKKENILDSIIRCLQVKKYTIHWEIFSSDEYTPSSESESSNENRPDYYTSAALEKIEKEEEEKVKLEKQAKIASDSKALSIAKNAFGKGRLMDMLTAEELARLSRIDKRFPEYMIPPPLTAYEMWEHHTFMCKKYNIFKPRLQRILKHHRICFAVWRRRIKNVEIQCNTETAKVLRKGLNELPLGYVLREYTPYLELPYTHQYPYPYKEAQDADPKRDLYQIPHFYLRKRVADEFLFQSDPKVPDHLQAAHIHHVKWERSLAFLYDYHRVKIRLREKIQKKRWRYMVKVLDERREAERIMKENLEKELAQKAFILNKWGYPINTIRSDRTINHGGKGAGKSYDCRPFFSYFVKHMFIGEGKRYDYDKEVKEAEERKRFEEEEPTPEEKYKSMVRNVRLTNMAKKRAKFQRHCATLKYITKLQWDWYWLRVNNRKKVLASTEWTLDLRLSISEMYREFALKRWGKIPEPSYKMKRLSRARILGLRSLPYPPSFVRRYIQGKPKLKLAGI